MYYSLYNSECSIRVVEFDYAHNFRGMNFLSFELEESADGQFTAQF